MKSTIVKLFEKVQKIPYKVCKFDEKEINENIECGDCRHKSFLLKNLLEKEGFNVRLVKVIFDWKDLPLPKDMSVILKKSGTIWPHNIIEVKINEKWIKIDCGWDVDLEKAGFPVTRDWDGNSDTKQITEGRLKFYDPQEYANKHKINIDKEEAHKFADELNRWLEKQRHK